MMPLSVGCPYYKPFSVRFTGIIPSISLKNALKDTGKNGKCYKNIAKSFTILLRNVIIALHS
jgi:hypothetical protein